VQFALTGSTLYLEFSALDEGGSLELRRTSDTRVAAQAGSSNVELIVLVNGLRVANSGIKGVQYQVEVPASVETVIVSAAGREIGRIAAFRLERTSLPLR
jgi:hypothetical protein